MSMSTREKWGPIRALKCRLGLHAWMPNNADDEVTRVLGRAYCLYCPKVRR
jgi:hypothetical protein